MLAILDCRSVHGIPRVHQETFLKVHLEKDHRQLSKIHGIWHLLAEKGPGNTGIMMEYGRGVRREPQSSSIPTPRIYLRDFRSRKCILEILGLIGISMLESELQD